MSNTKVDVSVIVPNYNSGDLLKRCLASVKSQTFFNWEVVVVDNNSTDESRDYLNSISDERIKVLQIQNNGVIATSRNLAAKNSRGRYLAFLDADDWWEPEKLSSAVHFLEIGQGDLIYHRLRRSPRKLFRPYVGGRYSKIDKGLLKYGNRIPNSSVVLKSVDFWKVGGFDESPNIVACEDFDLWERLSHQEIRFHFQREVLGSYHEMPGSMNSSDRRIRSALYLIKKHDLPFIPGWLRLVAQMQPTDSQIQLEKLGMKTPFSSYIKRIDVLIHLYLFMNNFIKVFKFSALQTALQKSKSMKR